MARLAAFTETVLKDVVGKVFLKRWHAFSTDGIACSEARAVSGFTGLAARKRYQCDSGQATIRAATIRN